MDPDKSNYQLGPPSPLIQSEIAFKRGNNKRVHIDKACYLPLSNTECHHFWEHLGLRKDTFDAGCLLCLGVLVRLASAAVNYVSRQQLSTSVAGPCTASCGSTHPCPPECKGDILHAGRHLN